MGRVVGEVWATRKDPGIENMKLLIVQQLTTARGLQSGYVVAADSVGAGVGEVVLVAQGSSARQSEMTTGKPVDAVVMAIVDDFDVDDRDWDEFDSRSIDGERA